MIRNTWVLKASVARFPHGNSNKNAGDIGGGVSEGHLEAVAKGSTNFLESETHEGSHAFFLPRAFQRRTCSGGGGGGGG